MSEETKLQQIEETTEETKKIVKDSGSKMPSIIEPEGFMMLFWAIILDIMGVLTGILIAFFGLGLILSLIPDILGIITLGGWMWSKIGNKGKLSIMKKLLFVLKKIWAPALLELIPLSGIFTWWSIFVLYQLTKGSVPSKFIDEK